MLLVANFRLAPLCAVPRQILFDSFLLSDSSKSFCGHLIWENVLGRQGESRENSLEASVPKLGEHSLQSQKTEKMGELTSCQLNIFHLARIKPLLEHHEVVWQPRAPGTDTVFYFCFIQKGQPLQCFTCHTAVL